MINVFIKIYIINNVNLDEFDKILSYYISHHNKNFDLYFICEFKVKFDNNFTTKIEINYHYNIDTNNTKSYLLYYIDCFISRGYKFCNINHLTFNTISCMCNMKYEYYINQPMQAIELKLNMIIAKNPQLINTLDRNTNHPLIKKYSHIPFNN